VGFSLVEQSSLPKLMGKYSKPLSISVSLINNCLSLVQFCNGAKEPVQGLLEIDNLSKLINLLKGVKSLVEKLLLDIHSSFNFRGLQPSSKELILVR